MGIKEFGRALRDRRQKRSLTVKDLSEIVNISPERLNALETGKYRADRHELAYLNETLSEDGEFSLFKILRHDFSKEDVE